MATPTFSWWSAPPAWARYAVAVISVAIAVTLIKIIEYCWDSAHGESVLFLAIMFSSWFGGFRPGLVAIALTFVAFDYYFVPPENSFAVNLDEIPSVIIFGVLALLVGLLSSAQRSMAESLRQNVKELHSINETLHAEVAERKRAEEDLRRSQAELAHITRMTTMGELAASIAHEVKQPLTAIINNAGACLGLLPQQGSNLGDVRDALSEIIDDTNRASSVMTRVRDLARKAPVEKKVLNLKEVVTDVMTLARYESGTRLVTIRTELPQGLPPVLGDRVQVQQVLLNLILNGMDAMAAIDPSDRILIISGRREKRNENPEVWVSVRDSGAGVQPDEMDRLFEAFYTTKPQGMGMGLAISRSIIEAHGGRLWFECNQGPGTTFLFGLPEAGTPLSS